MHLSCARCAHTSGCVRDAGGVQRGSGASPSRVGASYTMLEDVRMTPRFRCACAIACLTIFALGAGTASAQFRAGIQGTITDATGGAIPGATVVVTNKETSVSQDTVSNESGFYR